MILPDENTLKTIKNLRGRSKNVSNLFALSNVEAIEFVYKSRRGKAMHHHENREIIDAAVVFDRKSNFTSYYFENSHEISWAVRLDCKF